MSAPAQKKTNENRVIKGWNDLEAEVQRRCETYQRTLPFAWLRLTDTRAAGNFVKKQPSDFLVVYDGFTTLLEVKFSDKHESLRGAFSSNVSANQTASAFIWTRANANYLFVFYSSLTKEFEVWDGLYCFNQRKDKKQLQRFKARGYSTLDAIFEGEILRD